MMEKQTEKKTESEMDTGVVLGFKRMILTIRPALP